MTAKRPSNYRLTETAKGILANLREWYACSETVAVEVALRIAQRAGPPAGQPLSPAEMAAVVAEVEAGDGRRKAAPPAKPARAKGKPRKGA